jgi:hypothetical protein
MPVGGILCRTAVELRAFFESPTVGVGIRDEPDPVAPVRGAKGRRRQMIPFRIEPARGKVRKDDVESSNSESWDILHDDVAGS